MDLLTQGLLGASLAAASARPAELRLAAAIGGVAGLLPDADTLLRSADDPLLVLEYHRHFSHALVMVPVLALVVALAARAVLRQRLPFARIVLYALLGSLLAGVLDACTSYGTHLWWPFSDEPVAWSIVAIVDPLFSLALLVGLALALRRRHAPPARIGLLLAAGYLALGAFQHQRALDAAEALAAARNHAPERLLVKPTIGNLVLWRSLYVAGGVVHADGIRVGLSGAPLVYDGDAAPLFEATDPIGWAPPGSLARHDVERFAAFSAHWLTRDPRDPERLGDARYAMLPTSLEPLWMIAPGGPGGRARFVTERGLDAGARQRFIDMLLGRNADASPVAR